MRAAFSKLRGPDHARTKSAKERGAGTLLRVVVRIFVNVLFRKTHPPARKLENRYLLFWVVDLVRERDTFFSLFPEKIG